MDLSGRKDNLKSIRRLWHFGLKLPARTRNSRFINNSLGQSPPCSLSQSVYHMKEAANWLLILAFCEKSYEIKCDRCVFRWCKSSTHHLFQLRHKNKPQIVGERSTKTWLHTLVAILLVVIPFTPKGDEMSGMRQKCIDWCVFALMCVRSAALPFSTVQRCM